MALTSWEHFQAAVFVKDPVSDYQHLMQQSGLGEVLMYDRQPHTMREAVGKKVIEQQEQIQKVCCCRKGPGGGEGASYLRREIVYDGSCCASVSFFLFLTFLVVSLFQCFWFCCWKCQQGYKA